MTSPTNIIPFPVRRPRNLIPFPLTLAQGCKRTSNIEHRTSNIEKARPSSSSLRRSMFDV